MKTIAVLTATRAEYGLLSPIIHKLIESHKYKVNVVVTGAHLSPEFGLSYKEIEKDGISIHKKIEILLSADSSSSISKSMGMALIGFADYFHDYKPDALLVLGDRYETLAVVTAAMNEHIPVIHLYGGEITEGAIDDSIRHAITKLSYLHLTSTEEYRKRVIQLGENPDRVYTVGAIGIENVLKKELLNFDELQENLNWRIKKPYAVVTFHPVTLEEGTAEEQFKAILESIARRTDYQFIVTKANADQDGRIINQLLDEFEKKYNHIKAYDSLGSLRYLSALNYATFVMGNSSSGLIEVPSFGIPTINVGDRQKGRMKAESVIDCKPNVEEILNAICSATNVEFLEKCRVVTNPYGDGNSSEKIIAAIEKLMSLETVELQKKFFDINFMDR